MNCQRFADVVSDLARGQMMEADVRTAALVHSEACEKCAEWLTSEDALTRALHALSVQVQEHAPAGLESELRKAFREQHATSPTVVVAHSYRRYWLAVAAAILLLVGSVVAIRMRDTQPSPAKNQITTRDEAAVPRELPSAETVAVNSSGHESQKNSGIKPGRRRMASAVRTSQNRRAGDVATNHVREIATEFIPLSYSSGVSLQDGGQIVRVELPRSALVKFGLPVNMDRLNEKVKADVWLGVDGLAHAIRFVQ